MTSFLHFSNRTITEADTSTSCLHSCGVRVRVEGYTICYNNEQYNSGGHEWRLKRAKDDDQEIYFGLWPDYQLESRGRRTIFIHQRFFLQAFLHPGRQDDMFSLWPRHELGRITIIVHILRCPARELGISPGIIIIHDNMGQFRMIQVGSDDPSILA
jgi:hypothetical protein